MTQPSSNQRSPDRPLEYEFNRNPVPGTQLIESACPICRVPVGWSANPDQLLLAERAHMQYQHNGHLRRDLVGTATPPGFRT